MIKAVSGAVALDAMGGDHAPTATVQGAVEAVRQFGLQVLLVGREGTLRRQLAYLGGVPRGLYLVDAPEVVAMDDPPIAPIRTKRRDIYAGTVDVVVCDGFVGNVVLTVSEGLGEMTYGMLRREGKRSLTSAIGLLLAKGALTALKRKADYAEYGGAPLLGVRGACLVGHGRSNPKAIKNALRFAHAYATHGVISHIEAKIGELRGRQEAQEVERA